MMLTLPVRTHLRSNLVDVDRRGWNGRRQEKTPDWKRALVKKYNKAGWSRTEIRKELGLSYGTISKIIGGTR